MKEFQEKLRYQTFLLGGAAESDELPMIVPLHSMASDGELEVEVFLSEFTYPARVCAPNAPIVFDKGYSWFPEALYDESEAKQGDFCLATTKNLLENVVVWKQEHPTSGRPIFLGVSQGGDICFMLAARFADQFAATIPIAGRLLTAVSTPPEDSPGIIHVHHGQDDAIVPIDTVRHAVSQLQASNLNVTLSEYEGVGHATPLAMRTAIQQEIYSVLKKGK